jgi:hypothetical protein
MTYLSVYRSSIDSPLRDRITACATQEAWNNPAAYETEYGKLVRTAPENALKMIWPVCVASDVEAAYAYAVTAGNPNPGGDETVITDGMIIANVQAKWPQDPEPPPVINPE